MGKKRAQIDITKGTSFDLLWNDLTKREKEVYKAMSELGCGAKDLAKIFDLSDRTVESHLLNIYIKFGFTKGSPEAIAAYYQNKIKKMTETGISEHC
jgi:DNA-binding CsgD family transcriptional regulator